MSKSKSKLTRYPRFWNVIAAIIFVVCLFVWQQEGIGTQTYHIKSPDLPSAFDGLRIVQLSDLHGKEFGANNETLLAKVAELKPDMIAVTGDLIDEAGQLAMVGDLAKKLVDIAPTYYVTGNHEWAVRRVNDLKQMLADSGVTVLSGEYVTLERDGQTMVVAGIDDPNGPTSQISGPELRAEIAAEQGESYTLLLAHRDAVDEYMDWGYDAVLCGHGHGGIVRIPLLNKGLLSTDRTFFPRYDGGAYELPDGGKCIVSRGLGNVGISLRLFNRPDLPLILLEKEA